MASLAQVIIVSPDSAVREVAESSLRALGHDALGAPDVRRARRLLARSRIDLLCLDSLIPVDDAQDLWQLAAHAGEGAGPVPVLILGSPRNRLASSTLPPFFRAGRDGFVAKPLAAETLAAEVARLIGQRPHHRAAMVIEAAGAVLDVRANKLLLPGYEALDLTPTECRLLRSLMQRGGDFLTPEELLQEAWGFPPGTGAPEIVRAHVSNLRRKLRSAGLNPQLLRTLPYRGYGFMPP